MFVGTKRIALRFAPVVAGACMIFQSSLAHAQALTVDQLADRLRNAEDYRVRSNAAIALGQKTGDDGAPAVQPLCDALGDGNELVRTSAAVSLKRLARTSGLPCLKTHLASESSESVKLALSRAIESIESNGGGGGGDSGGGGGVGIEPRDKAGAKYYVSYAIANRANRPEADGLVVQALKDKLDSSAQFQFAPQKESADAARAAMKKKSLQGFYLSISVEKVYAEEPSGGYSLKIKVNIAVSSYPGKALRGSFGKNLSQGVSKQDDTSAEQRLIGMAAGLALDQFAQNPGQFL